MENKGKLNYNSEDDHSWVWQLLSICQLIIWRLVIWRSCILILPPALEKEQETSLGATQGHLPSNYVKSCLVYISSSTRQQNLMWKNQTSACEWQSIILMLLCILKDPCSRRLVHKGHMFQFTCTSFLHAGNSLFGCVFFKCRETFKSGPQSEVPSSLSGSWHFILISIEPRPKLLRKQAVTETIVYVTVALKLLSKRRD